MGEEVTMACRLRRNGLHLQNERAQLLVFLGTWESAHLLPSSCKLRFAAGSASVWTQNPVGHLPGTGHTWALSANWNQLINVSRGGLRGGAT